MHTLLIANIIVVNCLLTALTLVQFVTKIICQICPNKLTKGRLCCILNAKSETFKSKLYNPCSKPMKASIYLSMKYE